MAKEELVERLVDQAREGMKNAYCPRSEFPVGAAVLTTKGNFYQGGNVESVIAGLGTCAERCAIDHAIAHGEYTFEAICVVSTLEEPIKPCGACRQYISEFAQVGKNNPEIIMIGSTGKIVRMKISELILDTIGPRDLELDLTRYES